MSSTFEYSREEQLRLFAQFASVIKLAAERKRPASKMSDVLQAMICDDEIVVVPKITVTPTGKVFHVTGNARSAKQAIDALGCPVKLGLADKPAEIPMIIQPVDCRARAVPLGQARTTEEIYRFYPRILTPAEFFAFGAKFPEEQREAPHFTVWLDANGQFWYALLNVIGADGVSVRQVRPGFEWHGFCRVSVRE